MLQLDSNTKRNCAYPNCPREVTFGGRYCRHHGPPVNPFAP